MLINLSNHPFAYWGGEQRRSALAAWGDVEDMAFPTIDPAASREQLMPIVDECFSRCCAVATEYGAATAFHIMGESVFCYHIVARLLAAGYRVVASTTTRNTEYLPDGRKIATFDFVNFRDY